jgi:hypothetical protein
LGKNYHDAYILVVKGIIFTSKHIRQGRSNFEIGKETSHGNIKMHKNLTLFTVTFTNSSTEND